MGENPVPPMPPRFVIVKVPPSISAGVSFLSLALRGNLGQFGGQFTILFLSTSRMTGTSRPRSVSTATPT